VFDWPGVNQVISLDTLTEVTFLANCGFYTGVRNWDEFVAHVNPIIAGDFFNELGMGDNWDPSNTVGTMNNNGDGVFTWETLLPEGDWEYKVALNQNWDQDTYGGGGNFSVSSDGLSPTIFSYDFRQNSTYHAFSSNGCSLLGDVNCDENINVLDIVVIVNCIVNTCQIDESLGDYNNDGILNVLDIVLMINMILSNEYSVVADVNEDGSLDVLDVVLMVNILVGGLPQSN
jgi:hypothetical protein